MAVPGVFDSSAPFVVAGGGPLFSKDDFSRGCDEQTDPLVRLSRAMQHGTAKHVVVEAGEDQPCLSIVAQAESKTALRENNRKCFLVRFSVTFPSLLLT